MEKFIITGSKHLKKALSLETNIPLYSEIDILDNFTYMTPFTSSAGLNVLGGTNFIYDINYTLPEDWDNAVNAIKEYFKPKFKVGDWITTFDRPISGTGGIGFKPNITLEISSITHSEGVYWFRNYPNGIYLGNFRLATKEEIDNIPSKVFTLSCKTPDNPTFELEVSRRGIYYRSDDQYLDVGLLKALIKPIMILHDSGSQDKPYEFTQIVEYVNLGCKKKVSVQDITKVLDYYHQTFCK